MTEEYVNNTQIERYILGITSVWAYIPAIYGILYYTNNIIYNYTIKDFIFLCISIFITIVSFASIMHWYYSIKNSIYHSIDRIFANILFITLLYISFSEYNITNFTLLIKILFPICIIVLYIYSLFKDSFIGHLWFRFIGYIWLHFNLITQKNQYYIIGILSIIYWLHIIINYIMLNSDTFESIHYYKKGCCQLFFIILLCIIMQIISDNYIY